MSGSEWLELGICCSSVEPFTHLVIPVSQCCLCRSMKAFRLFFLCFLACPTSDLHFCVCSFSFIDGSEKHHRLTQAISGKAS